MAEWRPVPVVRRGRVRSLTRKSAFRLALKILRSVDIRVQVLSFSSPHFCSFSTVYELRADCFTPRCWWLRLENRLPRSGRSVHLHLHRGLGLGGA